MRRIHYNFMILLSLLLSPAYALAEAVVDTLTIHCSSCHSQTAGINATIPSINGLDSQYLARVMMDYKNGKRLATIMDRIARGYSDNEIKQMAEILGRGRFEATTQPINKTLAEQGRKIHQRSLCEKCHEEGGREPEEGVPILAGQRAVYLYYAMEDYQKLDPKTIKNKDLKKMLKSLKELKPEELNALSQFYASNPKGEEE